MSDSAEPVSRRTAQFVRVAETERARLTFHLDGAPVEALAGDTLLTALLCNSAAVRNSEFGDGARAGFCNMGACQDCWIDFEDGTRARACTAEVQAGMRVRAPRAGG